MSELGSILVFACMTKSARMKNLTSTLLSVLIISTISVFAGDQIHFEDSEWEAVVEKALIADKPIFLEGFANYCMPCRIMEEQVFTDKDLSLFFNEHFISYKVNVQTEEGKLLQFLYDIKALPDLLFVDPRGNIISRNNGSAGVSEVLAMGAAALDLFQTKSYENYTPYDNELVLASINRESVPEKVVRERSERKMSRHSGMTSSAKANKNSVLESFAAELPSRIAEDNVSTLIRDISLYRAASSKEYVDQQITMGIKSAVVEAVADRNYRGVKKSMRVIKKVGLEDHKNLSFQMEALYSMATGDWSRYARQVDKKFKRNYYVSINLMERAATAVLENTKKKVALRKAKKWLKQVESYSPTTEIESCEYLMDYALIY